MLTDKRIGSPLPMRRFGPIFGFPIRFRLLNLATLGTGEPVSLSDRPEPELARLPLAGHFTFAFFV